MTKPVTLRTNTLDQWRLNLNTVSDNVGDPANIYSADGVDTFSHPSVNLVVTALNDLNTRKVKRSGDTIANLAITTSLTVGTTAGITGALSAGSLASSTTLSVGSTSTFGGNITVTTGNIYLANNQNIYFKDPGGVDRLGIGLWADTTFNIAVAGGGQLRILNQAMNTTLLNITNAGAVSIPSGGLNVAGTTIVSGIVQGLGSQAGNSIATATGSLGGLWCYNQNASTLGGGAFMTFHRGGVYAAYFGLDSDNVLKYGGWSVGAVAYPIAMGNGGTYSMNITGSAGTAGTANSVTNGAYVNVNNLFTQPQRISAGNSSYTIYGPNATWNASLYVGAYPPGANPVNIASIGVTSGNMHIDSGGAPSAIYLNYYNTTAPVYCQGTNPVIHTANLATYVLGQTWIAYGQGQGVTYTNVWGKWITVYLRWYLTANVYGYYTQVVVNGAEVYLEGKYGVGYHAAYIMVPPGGTWYWTQNGYYTLQVNQIMY